MSPFPRFAVYFRFMRRVATLTHRIAAPPDKLPYLTTQHTHLTAQLFFRLLFVCHPLSQNSHRSAAIDPRRSH